MSDIGCARCDSRWSGTRTSHCGGCHLTFTGLTAFDAHRTGTHAKRSCLDPAALLDENEKSDRFGEPIFKLTDRAYPCWGFAAETPQFWKES